MTKLLQPDIYQRSKAWPSSPNARRRLHDVMIFGALIVVSLGLAILDRFEYPAAAGIRNGIQDAATPLLRAATAMISPVVGSARNLAEWQSLAEDRNRLRDENERLRSWQARAQVLEQQSVALAELAHVVEEPKLAFLTARIVSGQGGVFVRGALIDAGRDHGIKPGYPVLSAQGLVGRVIATGTRSARLLLLTDYNSRIPVIIGKSGARAVVQGDNGPLPKIAYLQPGNPIKPGDDVVTSGVGGLYPRGLRVGSVVDTGEALYVEPSSRLGQIEYVSVLFFETLAATLADDERSTEARAGLSKRLGPSWPTSAEGGIAR